jgi:hypothetical protein
MENMREMFESSKVQVRQMIREIGLAVFHTVVTTQNALLEEDGDEAFVKFAIMTGALNAIGAYVAEHVSAEADRRGATEHFQAGLHKAITALLQARPVVASLGEDVWPTGRTGAA